MRQPISVSVEQKIGDCIVLRIAPNGSQSAARMSAQITANGLDINAIDADDFVSAEPTPKPESRRGWRRRRIRRGKS